MSFTLDLPTVRLLAGPGLAFVLAGHALAINIGLCLCLYPPYRRVPTLITWSYLLLCGLLLTSTWIELVVEPGGWLMLTWCSALVVLAYLTAGLRLLDCLLLGVPTVFTSVQENAKALIGPKR
jgi:hypothetical protein